MKKIFTYLILTSIISLISNCTYAQTYTQMVDFADEKADEGDYYYAIDYYYKAMKIDSNSVEINWKMAEAQRYYKDYVKAEYYYLKVFQKENAQIYPYSIFWLGSMQHYNGKYKEATGSWKTAKKIFKRQRKEYVYKKSMQEFKSCLWAKKAIVDTTDYLVNPITKKINSQDSELAPFIKGDEFYFTSLKADSTKTNEELITEEYSLQIYSSGYDGNEFSVPEKVKDVYQAGYHSANGCYSADGDRFYFSKCNNSYQCKIFVGKVVGDKITDIDSLGEVINQEGKTTTMPNLVQVDGKEILFFVSNREKTIGGLDIWYSEIRKGNQYMKPRNLGPKINSPDNDISPFYDTISKRLYFSSSWHSGYGGHDVFYADKMEGVVSFLKPVNLGVPINSSQNDTYFIVDNKYDKFYLSSNRIGSNSAKTATCCNDIFVAELPKDETPPPRFANLYDLNRKLPVTLYFHNDEPNPRTRDTVTKLTYMESYDDYIDMVPKYEKEYSKDLIGDRAEGAKEDISDFFIEFVEQGIADLDEFTRLLIIELNKGYKIQVTVKGFASPLAKTDYNVNLTKRRISSLINYLYLYGTGEFKPYLDNNAENGGQLTFVQIPFGEYTANRLISDNVNDTKNSVYSRKAALERKIEIQSVSLIVADSSYAEINFQKEIHDFGKSTKGDILEYTFKFTNTGKNVLKISDIEVECSCTKAEISKNVVQPGETGAVKVFLDTKTLDGLSIRKIILHSNTKKGTKEVSLTTEVFE
jgi:hypothetical protein